MNLDIDDQGSLADGHVMGSPVFDHSENQGFLKIGAFQFLSPKNLDEKADGDCNTSKPEQQVKQSQHISSSRLVHANPRCNVLAGISR